MDFNLGLAIVWYVIFVVSTIFHEAAHALVALKLGDPTAYQHGLVTLDPVPHLRRSPFGMIAVPIVSFLLAGWMVGWASVPCDPYWAQSNRRKAAKIALAGPAADLAMVVLAALVIRAGILLGHFHAPEQVTFNQVTAAAGPGPANGVAVIVSIFFSLNLILFVFNLIPLPPLDGSQGLLLVLDASTAERYMAFMYQPSSRIIGFIVAWNLMDYVFGPIHLLALNILYPGAGYH